MRFEELIDRARALTETGTRRILGIAGVPGPGKSTLAAVVAARLGAAAAQVPMDGLHLADVELARLGRLDRKGAPDTFDAFGYVALLRRLRAAEPGEVVYAPAFERTMEQPVAGSIAIDPSVPLVVTEGNYLLLPDAPWDRVRPLLDEACSTSRPPTTKSGSNGSSSGTSPSGRHPRPRDGGPGAPTSERPAHCPQPRPGRPDRDRRRTQPG